MNDVYFHVNRGEVFCLIGPNGAGKTTLFNIIAGLNKPDKGKIQFNGELITNLRPDQVCLRGIARTFQIPKPFLNLSVQENVTVGAYFGSARKQSLEEAKKRAEAVIVRTGLKEKIYALASNLTLLERKRLELARALATEPGILLLDEVIAGLNPTEALKFTDTILEVRASGITIFMIEHVIRVVMKISDRILVLHYGKKIAEGTPGEIVSHSEVVQAYLGGGECLR